MRIAVIGAGVSGLVVARYLKDEGVTPVVFERSPDVGGVWVFREDLADGGGPAYRSLHTNTSRQVTGLSDRPFPDDLPVFPHRLDVVAYLESYATRFGLRESIRFRTRVERVRRTPKSKWTVTTQSPDGERTEVFDAVVVCSGIHWCPVTPAYPGLETYTGRVLHSMGYKEPDPFAGEDVLVVGVGSSAADIAAEAAGVAGRTTLSTRSGAWIAPRYLDGRPFDHRNSRLAGALPARLRTGLLRRRLLDEYRRRGLDDPTAIWGAVEPKLDGGRVTTSDGLLSRLACDAVHVRPNIQRIDGAEVLFADGTRARPSTIVFCTGYTRRFPFLADMVTVAPDSSIELYKHVFHPDLPALAFVGMCRAQGSVFPVIELQARWVARVLTGSAHLPAPDGMRADIGARRLHQLRLGAPPMRVSVLEYGDEIAREIGARPRLWRHPRLFLPLLIGPPVAAQYRLDGPGRQESAARQVRAAGARASIVR